MVPPGQNLCYTPSISSASVKARPVKPNSFLATHLLHFRNRRSWLAVASMDGTYRWPIITLCTPAFINSCERIQFEFIELGHCFVNDWAVQVHAIYSHRHAPENASAQAMILASCILSCKQCPLLLLYICLTVELIATGRVVWIIVNVHHRVEFTCTPKRRYCSPTAFPIE